MSESTLTHDDGANTAARVRTRHDAVESQLDRIWFVAVMIALAAVAWRMGHEEDFTARSDIGYALGIAGGSLMLALFLYPLRKHSRLMRPLGALKHWFRLHMYLGILGPYLIILHTGFQLGSLNANVAFTCMLIVMCSGIVGRFLYRRVHRGLYGARSSLNEVKGDLARHLTELNSDVKVTSELKALFDAFRADALRAPEGRLRRARHFLLLGHRRRKASRAARNLISRSTSARVPGVSSSDRLQLVGLETKADEALRAMQRTAEFETYERLFNLWHVAHVPFVYLFLLTAVVHVVAVHVY